MSGHRRRGDRRYAMAAYIVFPFLAVVVILETMAAIAARTAGGKAVFAGGAAVFAAAAAAGLYLRGRSR